MEGPLGPHLSLWGPTGKLIMSVEVIIHYLIFGAYIFFVYHFLNLKKYESLKLDRTFKFVGGTMFFAGMIFFAALVIFGLEPGRSTSNIFRILLSSIVLTGIMFILIRYSSTLTKYLLVGTLLLVIPASFTAFVHWAEGHLGYYIHLGLLRGFTFYDWDLTVYV